MDGAPSDSGVGLHRPQRRLIPLIRRRGV